MDSIKLTSILPKPRQRRAYMVESLYGDRLSFFVGGLAIVAAAAFTAIRNDVPALWLITSAIGAMVVLRMAAFELFLANVSHADHHPRFWNRLYSGLGILHLALIGCWNTIVYWLANDQFSELVSVFVTLGFLIGLQGRNFSSLSLVRCQMLACLIPMVVAFAAHSATWSITLGLFLVAFYFAVLKTSRRIRGMLHQAIEASEQNWRLAHTDALSGLPNGTVMRSTIERAIAERHPFTLLIVDLDRFKRVNDTLGHLAGDQFLRQTATTLERVVARTGLVSRDTGDAFSILHLGGDDGRSTAEVAEEIVSALGRPVVVSGATMPSACSIGMARFPEDGESYEEISHNADMALFEAQRAGGRQTVAFTHGTPDRAAERLQIENDLRQALENGGLDLYFQPIVENRTFRVANCEALVRWDHPTRGPLSPGEFLSVAEDSGLMGQLTDRTFEDGCRAAVSWPPHVGLSINLSPSQLCRPDLLTMISSSLSKAGLDASRLEIEITENMLLDGRPDVIETLHRIRELGVALSLDDFGTGYSNLGQIALLPIEKIKIDKVFLKGVGTNERLTAVLSGAIQFIASLGLPIVMEGLETEEQVNFAVGQEGITLLQGYAFGIPMPRHAIGDFLASASGQRAAQQEETGFVGADINQKVKLSG